MSNPLFISASLLVLLLQLTNVEAHQDNHALRQKEGKLKTEVKLKTRDHALEHLGKLFKKHKEEKKENVVSASILSHRGVGKAKKGNKDKELKAADHEESCDGDFCDLDMGEYLTKDEHPYEPLMYTLKSDYKKDVESFGPTYLKHYHQYALQGRAFRDPTCSPSSQIAETGKIQYDMGKSSSRCRPFEGNTDSVFRRWYKESTDGSCWNKPDGTTEVYTFADIYEDAKCEKWVANDVIYIEDFPAGCFWDSYSNNYKNYRCTEVLTPFNSFLGLYTFAYYGDNCENHDYPLPNVYDAEVAPLGKCQDGITVECSNTDRTLTVTEFMPKGYWGEGDYMCPMTDKLKTYTFQYSEFDVFNTCQDEGDETVKIVCIDGSGKIANRHTEYVQA